MSLGKSILQGMMGAFLMEGMEINKIDLDNHILYISLPKQSYSYNSDKIKCAEDCAKRIKETWIELGIFPPECSVRYKIKDVNWTREMGNKNFNDNISKVINLTTWG